MELFGTKAPETLLQIVINTLGSESLILVLTNLVLALFHGGSIQSRIQIANERSGIAVSLFLIHVAR